MIYSKTQRVIELLIIPFIFTIYLITAIKWSQNLYYIRTVSNEAFFFALFNIKNLQFYKIDII